MFFLLCFMFLIHKFRVQEGRTGSSLRGGGRQRGRKDNPNNIYSCKQMQNDKQYKLKK
jgi:hypothetical protein